MAFNYSLKIVTNGLVLCLDAANTKSYPGSGTVWTDLSRGGYNETLINGPTFNSGNGGSIVFDGVNDYAQTTTNYAFGLNPFTINVWFKSALNQVLNSAIICIASPQSDINWQISFSTNTLNFFSGPINTASSYISNNQWTHITVVRNSTSTDGSSFYINSIFDKNFTSTNNFTAVDGYRIGMNRGSSAWYNGNIANIQIYNRALSATEILQNYNATKTRFGL